MTAAHAPGDHQHSPGGAKATDAGSAARSEFGALEGRPAATGDLLDVAKALLV
jgi:hypothetical protein